MVAALRLATLAALSVFFANAAVADIVAGTSRADVIAELGKPTSIASRGAREILVFPHKVRIELENGVVVDIKGYTPPAGTTPTPAPAAAPTPAPAPTEPAEPPEKPDEPAATAPTAEKSAPKNPNADLGDSPAAAANALGDEVAKMGTAWGGEAPPSHPPPKPKFSWVSLLVGLVLRFGITVAGLKLAFKYWEMDAFWPGVLAIAGIDAAVEGGLEALAPVTQGFTTLGHVNEAIAWCVMIFTIQRFCFNKRIQNAVLTAVFVKVMAAVLIIFVSIGWKAAFRRGLF